MSHFLVWSGATIVSKARGQEQGFELTRPTGRVPMGKGDQTHRLSVWAEDAPWEALPSLLTRPRTSLEAALQSSEPWSSVRAKARHVCGARCLPPGLGLPAWRLRQELRALPPGSRPPCLPAPVPWRAAAHLPSPHSHTHLPFPQPPARHIASTSPSTCQITETFRGLLFKDRGKHHQNLKQQRHTGKGRTVWMCLTAVGDRIWGCGFLRTPSGDFLLKALRS